MHALYRATVLKKGDNVLISCVCVKCIISNSLSYCGSNLALCRIILPTWKHPYISVLLFNVYFPSYVIKVIDLSIQCTYRSRSRFILLLKIKVSCFTTPFFIEGCCVCIFLQIRATYFKRHLIILITNTKLIVRNIQVMVLTIT